MKGIVSFHPVDVAFFDETIAPLIAGGKIDPERFLSDAIGVRKIHWQVRRYPRAIETVRAAGEPPGPAAGASLWERTKSYLERFDWRPDDLTRKVLGAVDPDLHLSGRPFFVAEVSAAKVVEAIDRYRTAASPRAAEAIAKEQLARLDPDLARDLSPEEASDLSADLLYRSDLLAALARIHELAAAARADRPWGDGEDAGRPAREVLRDELPWRALYLHARVVPFWTATDMDGLETICRAAKVPTPEMLVPARRLFAAACEEFADLKTTLHLELKGARDVGAFVAPDEIPKLLDYLTVHGARIIQAAARAGEGPACATLLRKIRECATYAEKRGFGYLEASGIAPPDLEDPVVASA